MPAGDRRARGRLMRLTKLHQAWSEPSIAALCLPGG
jgi:hypothetical protein